MGKSMRKLFCGLLLVIPTSARSEGNPEEIESIRKAFELKGVPEKGVVPEGFTKGDETKGDLNGDGFEDIAMIVHRTPGKAAKPAPEEGGEAPDDEDYPQYVVLFTGDKAGGYSLWKFGANHFMESNRNLMEEGGIGGMEIKNRVLTISSSVAMSMGGWSAGGCTQKWRNEKSGFRLIGLTITDVNRGCACGTTTDINFLTGLEIYDTDRDGEGNQMDKSVITKTRKKRKPVFWENFSYDEMCSG